jgi:hypothetical protein
MMEFSPVQDDAMAVEGVDQPDQVGKGGGDLATGSGRNH